jgi:hypothetical protein
VPIKTLNTYLPRLGRVSLGFKTRTDKGVVVPRKADTLCFTSDVRARVETLAGIYGGTVREAIPGADGADRWLLVSEAVEANVVIPSNDMQLVFSEWMELHTASGLKRRCDGERVVTGKEVDGETGEITLLEDVPCVCREFDLVGPEACKPTLRLNVILPDALDAEGLGVWLVTSTGWRSNQHVNAALKTIQMFFGDRIAGMPLVLGMQEAKAQVPGKNGKPTTTTYRHFTLRAATSMREALANVSHQGPLAERVLSALPAPVDEPDGEEVTVEEASAAAADQEEPQGGAAGIRAGGGSSPPPGASSPAASPSPAATPAQLKRLRALAERAGVSIEEVCNRFEVAPVEKLTVAQANQAMKDLEGAVA